MAIQSFGDKTTERFFLEGRLVQGTGWAPARSVVKRKLDMLHYSFRLPDLRSPPGNRLEALKGRLQGYYNCQDELFSRTLARKEV